MLPSSPDLAQASHSGAYAVPHVPLMSERNTIMRRLLVLAVVVLLTSPLVVHAQPPRIAAFQLQCFRPTTPAYHTSATLIARIILANRTVWAVASCQDGPAQVTWPEVQWEDGQVLSLDVWMTAQASITASATFGHPASPD